MRSALINNLSDPEQDSSHWIKLPGLCCQAAGGDPVWAEDLAQAWALFYAGAGILDKIEDRDQPDPWWANTGEGVAANAASGLYFTASLLLDGLYSREETRDLAREIVVDFYQTLLSMSSGQHRDLTTPEPNLEEYWQIAAAKSGEFFSLACRSGARLATKEPARIQRFSDFGLHLGIILQIMDDLEDLKDLQATAGGNPIEIGSSLPVVYLLSVSPPEEQIAIRQKLGLISSDDRVSEEILNKIGQAGAGLYILAEIERHRTQALIALDQANPDPETQDELIRLLPKIEDI